MAKKKATTRRRRSTSGAEAHERRQHRLEERRRQRAAELAAARKRQQRNRLIRVLSLAVVAAGVISFLIFRTGGPSEIDGHPIEQFSASGLQNHTTETVDYETAPPVSGPHAPSPAPCGTHAEPIANEVQVHNLEHGAVGVLYRPELDPEQIARIEELVRSFESHVFSAPYPDMPSPITVTSWSRLMRLDELDAGAVRAYIEQFRAKGPEENDCPNTATASFRPSSTREPAGGGGG